MKRRKSMANAIVIAGVTAALVCAALLFAGYRREVKAASPGYKLVWSDEFSGTELNTNNWNCEEGNGGEFNNNPGWGNNELEYYTDRPENVSVSGGSLKITARNESYKGYKYTSARMQTSGKQSFQYGKLEARMKLPAVDGVWPAFWMLGYHDRGWPYCGELDIMESWNAAQFAQGAFHWFNEAGTGRTYGHQYLYGQMRQGLTNFKNFDKTQWHTYAIEWDSQEFKWLVDDIEFFKLDITDSAKSEAKGLYYFVLNLAVGGNLPGCEPDPASLPVTMEVDYVRAYQKAGTGSRYEGTWTEQDKVAQYNVNVTDGSSTLVSGKVYDGETLLLPEGLKKRGYIYKGVYTSDGAVITSETRVRGDIRASVRWEKVKVKKAVIQKAVGKKKKVKLTLKTPGRAKGYQIRYGTKKSLKGSKKILIEGRKLTVPRLKSGKKYYFKVRAYKLDSKNKKIYGKWSKVKAVEVK